MIRVNSSVAVACDWVARLAWLNLLWLVTTLAGGIVLGAFPATAAMYAVLRRWQTDPVSREQRTARLFWAEVRADLLRANLLGYAVVLVGLLLVADAMIARGQGGPLGQVLFALAVAAGAMVVVTVVHLPYFYVRDRGPARDTIRTAWWYALSHPAATFLIVAVAVVLSFVMGRYPALAVFFGVSVVGGLTVFLDERGFRSA
ncbi:YesL family protein [Kribbella sp. NPDC004875]|uniref:YesL family protein n=1 Tax=Kribbella sp. NPDC004875 TaxID=3364107 RepID=UPI00368D0B82